MKVHLVFAPSLYSSSSEILGENVWPPMGILYIAAYLRSRLPETEIKITDGCRIGYEKTIREITTFRPDILGISFYTTQTLGATRLAREIRTKLPQTLIVVGGPHATALPTETLRMSGADLCVVGEGEEAFHQIVEATLEGKEQSYFRHLPGAWSVERNRDNTEIVYRNNPAQFITPLDVIPYPARDLIDMNDYRGWFISKRVPQATMLFARGCPFRCTYCANEIWRSSAPVLRARSPKDIVEEMAHLHAQYGINEVYDQADEFNHSLLHALDVCKEMTRQKLGMSWQASLRAQPFSEELAKAMAEAGCWCASLGVESANERTLRGIKKYITLKDVESTCLLLQKYGIKVRAHFMLYNVWEEQGQLVFEDSQMTENTLNYARSLFQRGLINYMTWSVTTPFPGSELYGIAVRHNLINAHSVNNWDSWLQKETFTMDLPGISRKERSKVWKMGKLLQMRCMLKNRDYRLKDISTIVRRGMNLLLAEVA